MELKQLSKNGYVIIRKKFNTDDEIINYYDEFNKQIGTVQKADTSKYTGILNDVCVNIHYDGSESDKPWNTDHFLKLHTDNSKNYSNLTELVCLQPATYSVHTTLIKNDYVVKLIKFWDSYKNTNLFDKIFDLEVTFPDFTEPKKILQIKNGLILN